MNETPVMERCIHSGEVKYVANVKEVVPRLQYEQTSFVGEMGECID